MLRIILILILLLVYMLIINIDYMKTYTGCNIPNEGFDILSSSVTDDTNIKTNKISADDSSIISADDSSIISADDSSIISADDSSIISADDSSKKNVDDDSLISANIQQTNHLSVNISPPVETSKCGVETSKSKSKCGVDNLHPILDPRFNMRETAKQCLLLEDHLNNIKKRCYDCIRKHLLTIDALLEEAVSLEKDNTQRNYYRNLYQEWVKLEKQYSQNSNNSDNLDDISKKIRIFRKPLVEKYFDMVSEYNI